MSEEWIVASKKKYILTQISLTDAVREYYGQVLSQMVRDYNDLMKEYDKTLRRLYEILIDWIDGTAPTMELKAEWDANVEHLTELYKTIIALRNKIEDLRQKYFPEQVLFTRKPISIHVTYSDKLPPREKFKLHLLEITNEIRTLMNRIIADYTEFKNIAQEVVDKKKEIAQKMKADIVEKVRQIRDALEKGDELLAEQRKAELDAIITSYKNKWSEYVHSVIERQKDLFTRMQDNLQEAMTLIKEYVRLAYGSNSELYRQLMQAYLKSLRTPASGGES